MVKIRWTDYLNYRLEHRGFNKEAVENIIKYSNERYYDCATNRRVVIGKDGQILIMIPYETDNKIIIPITVHATNRQQINFRIKSGRFKYE